MSGVISPSRRLATDSAQIRTHSDEGNNTKLARGNRRPVREMAGVPALP